MADNQFIEVASLSTFKVLLTSVINKFHESLSGAVSVIDCVERVVKEIERLERVSTLIDPYAEKKLNDYYFQPRALSKREKKEFRPKSFSDFDFSRLQIVTGTAGQGKSILLRYLTVKELIVGKYVPIFVELRRIKAGDVISGVGERLKDFGFVDKSRAPLVERVLGEQNCLLVLDGYDEIPYEDRTEAVRQIDSILIKYPGIKIIVSSRQDASSDLAALGDVIELCPLSQSEAIEVVHKLSFNKEQAENVASALKLQKGISDFIDTPLLVALLVITYRTNGHIPENLPDFYAQVFATMSFFHDKRKGSDMRRARKSSISEAAFEQVFSATCFQSTAKEFVRGGRSSFLENVKWAVDFHGLKDVGEDGIFDDFVSVTCLITEDGFNEYAFVHKSIQEYYAASFISKLKEDRRAEFYKRALNQDGFDQTWQGVLRFLRDIDKLVYYEEYRLPGLNALFESKNGKTTCDRFVERVVKHSIIVGANAILWRTSNVGNLIATWYAHQVMDHLAPAIFSDQKFMSYMSCRTADSPDVSLYDALIESIGDVSLMAYIESWPSEPLMNELQKTVEYVTETRANQRKVFCF